MSHVMSDAGHLTRLVEQQAALVRSLKAEKADAVQVL